ncbi:Rv3654c family TadE-like protein [Agromyces tropicus]
MTLGDRVGVGGRGRRRPCPCAEDGAASVVAVSFVGVVVALAAAVVVVLLASLASQSAAHAADAAALAAADAVSGAVPGEPCALAAEVASRNGARLATCEVTGADALVSVVVDRGAISATAASRAGPAG